MKLRAASFLALPFLFVACSSSSSGGGPALGDAGGDTATNLGDTSNDGASDDAPAADSADANVDTGGGFVIDSAPVDAACTQLNIGIFGNPGANPSSNFQTWLQNAGTTVTRVQTSASEPLTADVLAPFDVVILDWLTRDYTSSEAAILATWISNGGGIAAMTGYDNNTTDDWHANSLMVPLAVAYNGPLLNGPVTEFATHPITAGLTSVTFNGGYAIADLGGTGSVRTPIAFLEPAGTKVNAGFAIEMGNGHAFVWGDEWIEFDSEWSTIPEIQQLWVQVFKWIAPANKCELHPR